MSFSSIDLCSRALNKIGAESIVSFEEGTPEAEICGSLYDTLKQKLLSVFEWSFAMAVKKLNRVIDGSENEEAFGNAFALPPDFLRAVGMVPDVSYRIVGNYLYTDAGEVKLKYIANVGEEYFSPIFISAFIYLMAAELSISLLNDTSKYSLFYRLFVTELREAKNLDSRQDTPMGIRHFALIDARK